MPLICQQREVGGEQAGCETQGSDTAGEGDNHETHVCFAEETPSVRVAPVTALYPTCLSAKQEEGDICSRRLEML